MNSIDDTRDLLIQIISHGDVYISDIQADPYVELNTPFTIRYTVQNTLEPATIYGVLLNTRTGNPVFHSFWTETFTGSKTITHDFPAGTTTNMDINIQVGVI